MKNSMSEKSQEPRHQGERSSNRAADHAIWRPLEPEDIASQSKQARLQAIRDRLRSSGYDIPPMLVAERIIDEALAKGSHNRD